MEVKPYPKNAKKHPDKQLQQIADSVNEFGWQQDIVVDKNGVIIAGQGRYAAYEKHNLPEPPIKVADLTEKQANAYRLADNKLNESDWDMQLVVEELKELDELAPLTGFDMDLLIEPEEQDDEVPEVPEEPQSKLGDLYELGEHRVLCGDALDTTEVDRLLNGLKPNVVFTDPPYGIGLDKEGQTIGKSDSYGAVLNDGDNDVAKQSYILAVSLGIPELFFGERITIHQYCQTQVAG